MTVIGIRFRQFALLCHSGTPGLQRGKGTLLIEIRFSVEVFLLDDCTEDCGIRLILL